MLAGGDLEEVPAGFIPLPRTKGGPRPVELFPFGERGTGAPPPWRPGQDGHGTRRGTGVPTERGDPCGSNAAYGQEVTNTDSMSGCR